MDTVLPPFVVPPWLTLVFGARPWDWGPKLEEDGVVLGAIPLMLGLFIPDPVLEL